MEPSTTIITNENKNKIHDHHHQLQNDQYQPLITSCKATPHDQEVKNSSNIPSSTCVVSEPFLIGNAVDQQETQPENEPIGPEKLVSHGGRIAIPERWGQEDYLKDWIDYSTFDALLAPKEAGLAREALVAEARRGCHVSKLEL